MAKAKKKAAEEQKITIDFTPELDAKLKVHTDWWIANALRTDPVDPARVESCIQAMYEAAELAKPKVYVVASPMAMAFAGSFGRLLLSEKKGAEHARGDARAIETPPHLRDLINGTKRALDALLEGHDIEWTKKGARAQEFEPVSEPTTYIEHLADAYWRLAFKFARDGAQADRMMEEASRWHESYQGGNMWSSYDCYLSAFGDVLNINLPLRAKYETWKACAIEGGFRYLHHDFCLVSDRPTVLTKDNQHRPHNETGPSHRWRDGWELYYWHGQRIPNDQAHIINDPSLITIDEIIKEENAEIRRVMIERMGIQRYVYESGAQLVHADVWHGLPRGLLKDRFGNAYLYGSDNSTGRIYAMPVAAEAKTCREAHVSICGFDESRIDAQS